MTEPKNIEYTIIDTSEIWEVDEDTNDDYFAHTAVVATDQIGQLYYAKSPLRNSLVELGCIQHELIPIPSNHIFPQYTTEFTLFDGVLDNSIYHKKPAFVCYDGTCDLADILRSEARVYERLQRRNNPRLARYHGCVVKEGRIIGLALSRYAETLEDRVERGSYSSSVDKWLRQISEGLQYIHEAGYAHNDINPRNIMVKDGGVVIIDLDACLPLGEELVKGGTMGWSDDSWSESAITNDDYGLRKIELLLRGQEV